MRSRCIVAVAAIASITRLPCVVTAIETTFQCQFDYEAPIPLHDGHTVVGPRVRWNTQSIVSSFGMEQGAQVRLQVTGFQVTPVNNSQYSPAVVPVIFTLYNIDQWRAYSVLKLREVHIRSEFVLCHYPASIRIAVPPPGREGALPWTMKFDVPQASLYTLQAQICGAASVNITGSVSMVNVGNDGELSEHLGIQELGLSPLYKVVLAWYLVGVALLMLGCFMWRRNAPRIYYVFQAAVQLKTISIALKLGFYREQSMYGKVPGFLDAAQDFSESTTTAALLGVSILGSLGWSITRATLSRREMKSLAAVVIIYAVVAVNKALCRPSDAPKCRAYLLSEYALQSMLMLGVIVALNYTIAQLNLETNYERWNSFETPLTYMKLDQFQRFRFIFLGYLLMPTFLLIINLVVITPPGSWRYAWVNTLLGEATTLIVVASIGLIARPIDSNMYSRIARSTDPNAIAATTSDTIDSPVAESPRTRRGTSSNVTAPMVYPASVAAVESN